MNKNSSILFLLFIAVITLSTIAMEQPSRTELNSAQLEYCRRRALVCHNDHIANATTENEREQILESALKVARNNLKESSSRASVDSFWSSMYGFISLFSCGIVAIGCQNNLDCVQMFSACMLCGVSIFSAHSMYNGLCDLCNEHAEQKIYKKKLKDYLVVQQLKPVQIIVERYDA